MITLPILESALYYSPYGLARMQEQRCAISNLGAAMKWLGYTIALSVGLIGGWLGQQFWGGSYVQPLQSSQRAELERSSARLSTLREEVLHIGPKAKVGDVRVDDSPEFGSIEQLHNEPIPGSEFRKQVERLIQREQYLDAVSLIYEQRVSISFEHEALYDDWVREVVARVSEALQESLRFEMLVAVYRQLVSFHPDHAPYSIELARWLLEIDQYVEAIQALSLARHDVTRSAQIADLEQSIAERQRLAASDNLQIPLERKGKHFIAVVQLNGQEGIRLLLDTGATLTALKSSVAERLDLEGSRQEPIRMRTANGLIDAVKVDVETFLLGEFQVGNTEVVLLPLPDFQYDGLLGMNVLSKYPFYIDQRTSMLHLQQ